MKRSKILPLLAAGLFLASLPLPYWMTVMDTPTYPEKDLSIRIYTYYYEGDVDEWNRVGKLVGVQVPPPIPEIAFVLAPLAVAGLALLAVAAAFRERWLKFVWPAPWLFLAAATVWTQVALYQFGHNLDPDRPLKYFEPFTPPVIGWVAIGKIVTYHLPHSGSALFVIAAVLLTWAEMQRRRKKIADVQAPGAN